MRWVREYCEEGKKDEQVSPAPVEPIFLSTVL